MADPFKLAFTDPEAMQAQVDEYFLSRINTRTIKQRTNNGETVEFEEEYMRPPTMAGLAGYLGVVRTTLLNYRKRGQEDEDPHNIGPVVARALNRLAEWTEEALYNREASNGARFALEVNHKYGKEEGGGGGGFNQTVIAPVVNAEQPLAIPVWGGDD